MKNVIVLILVLLTVIFKGLAQVEDLEKTAAELKKAAEKDSILGWDKGGTFMLNFNRTDLSTYWSAGGQNSIAISSLLSLHANYKNKRATTWENTLDLGYGIIRQGDRGVPFIKSEDRIDLSSKYGRRINDKLYYSALFNFRTQFAPGFSESDDSIYISKFLAPGYGILAMGLDYKPHKDFSFLFSPVTGKLTVVMDDSLSAQGTYGVDSGQIVRMEFGAYTKMVYSYISKDKKTSFTTKLELFTNYFNNFGYIDVNWENALSVQATKFLAFNLITQLLYDDDIKFEVDRDGDGVVDGRGPRIQFKSVLGVGIKYKF